MQRLTKIWKRVIDLTAKAERDAKSEDDWRKQHGIAKLQLQAEDSHWRKAFRTLEKKHNVLVKSIQERAEQDPLNALADKAALLRLLEESDTAKEAEEEAAMQDHYKAEQDRQEAEKKLQEVKERLQELEAMEAELVARATKLAALEKELVNQKASLCAERLNVDARISNAHQTTAVPKPEATAGSSRPTATNSERGSDSHNRWMRKQRDRLVKAFQELFGRQWHHEFRSSTKVELPTGSKKVDLMVPLLRMWSVS